MNMKKILLAGIAIGALASTGANAAAFNSARVSNIPLTPGTTVYTLANKTNVGTGLTTTTTAGHNAIALQPSNAPARFNNGSTYAVTFSLSGTASPVFAQVPTMTVTGATGTCTASTPSITGGGAVNSTTVTFQFAVSGTCDVTNLTPNLAILDAPFKITSVGTAAMTGNITLPTVGNGTSNYDDIGPATVQLLQTAPTYDLAIGATPYPTGVVGSATNYGTGVQLPTVWSATGGTAPFTTYVAAVPNTNDVTIGALRLNYAAAPANAASGALYSGLGATNVTGTFLGYDLAVTTPSTPGFLAMRPATFTAAAAPVAVGAAAVVAGNVATIVYTPIAAAFTAHSVNVAIVPNNIVPVTLPQSYKGTVTPKTLVNGLNPALLAGDPVTGDLETTLTQGFRIDAPWFGGSRAATPSLVRFSNSSTVATGSITLVLSNAVTLAGEPLTATSCSLAGVPAGQELLINTALATSCFGNFVRGDLAATVLGTVSSLTAKMRVLSANGSVSEQTLGNVTASTPVSN